MSRPVGLLFCFFLILTASACSRHPEEARGSEILLYAGTSQLNPRSVYLREILWAEGVRNFRAVEELREGWSEEDLLVLPPVRLTAARRKAVLDGVHAGGVAVVIRPQEEILQSLGLQSLGSVDGGFWSPYVGTGSLTRPLQFKGRSDLWKGLPENSRVLAGIGEREPLSPAVVEVNYGEGRLMLWAFDPIETVILLRQGNPELANQEIDGVDGIRPHEMVLRGFWNTDLKWIPQADLLQRSLVRWMEELLPTPLPRVWYFPGRARTMLVMTGDAHQETPEVIDQMLKDVESLGGTASIYLLPPYGENWPQKWVAEWTNRGHEISAHPDHETTADHNPENRRNTIASAVRGFHERYGIRVRTIRNDWLIWLGWVQQAQIQQELGVQMDLNFLSSQPAHYGYMFGSGMPMRFITEDGVILDHYQQPTHFEDDLIAVPDLDWSLQLDSSGATRLSITMLEESRSFYFNTICFNMHPGYYSESTGPWTRRTLAWARDHEIPIWNALRWLRFVLNRNAVRLEDLRLTESVLQARIIWEQGSDPVALTLPRRWGKSVLEEVRIGGQSAPSEQINLLGQERILVELEGSGSSLLEAIFGEGDP